eukprot:CAMPEP_0179121952 /NCGR_PEP_ID=MMETSP0796-20121207/57536_1 /TAXON_ID=73915 /ORGANISM="Pyrodinium bahamense, Strain pbaha01" /LENGTH=50 /DNA_ID=CAMNT_0020820561 /DNA_START=429 /DNA_END=581 /DNA_ORIENTATION=-
MERLVQDCHCVDWEPDADTTKFEPVVAAVADLNPYGAVGGVNLDHLGFES